MATTIVLTCPECNKQMKAASDLQGKKVRCKGCGHTFPVTVPAAAKAKAAPDPKAAKGKPAATPKAAKATSSSPAHQDDVGDGKPYGIHGVEESSRCPHCAAEMDGEQVICLECGYNTMTREQARTRKVVEVTGGDYFVWLLPGIACALLVFVLIGAICFLWIAAAGIIEDNKDEWWAFAPRAVQLWGSIFCLAIMFFAGKFSIKRLAFNYTPPEKERR